MEYEHLTADRLKELLNYDPETGVFTWRQRPYRNSRKRPGDLAGTPKGKGYLYIGIGSRTYLASQLAWLFVHGQWARGNVGVANKNPSDLRAENLVEVPTGGKGHDFSSRAGMVQYRREFKENNPGLVRQYGFKRYYGIDLAEYQRMFVEQNGACAICRQPETASFRGEVKWLSVDHCHTTKAVRGLLCSACNHGIGHMRDNPELLRAAAGYLDRFAAPGLREIV
jgi:Recombination endonuclease VII